MNPSRRSRRLLWHGVFLFLLGLLTGLLVPVLKNPRMGLSSHLEGVLNGMFLAVLGLIWPRLRLPAGAFTTAYWLALYGAYVNWATTLFAAWFGAGASMPLAEGKQSEQPWHETLIDIGLWSLAISMVVVCWVVLWGLRGHAGEEPPAGPA